MNLNQHCRALACAIALFPLCIGQAQDTGAPPPSAPPQRSAAELEKLAAPIALHPDPLISIILPASVYPLEIVQASRFVKDTNNIPKIDEQSWDDNVKAVAKFPSMIQKMNDELTWTTELGQAFVDQQKELMDTIQVLRGKAQNAGVLKTTPQQVIVVTNTVTQKTIETQVVYVTNTVVQIQPSNPEVVYVPTYPPTIYAPPPVSTGPPPILTFAAGVAVGAIIANNCDWNGGGIYVGGHGAVVWGGGGYHGHGDVNINNVNINTSNRAQVQNTKWQPDKTRMSSSTATSRSATPSAQARGWSSGATPTAANRATANAAPVNRAAAPAARPAASQSLDRATPSSAASASASRGSATGARESAFGGGGSGASTRQSSDRGSASRGGGGGGARGGGGRR
jgi:hypothetical protein